MKSNEPLAPYTTYKVGGPADQFAIAKSESQLIDLINQATAPFIIFAGGSNILFHDNGFRGLVIKIDSQEITINPETDQITASAGVSIPDLIRFAEKHQLQGLEPWLGLPGTVGGAIRGNAGCNGLETAQILTQARILDPKTATIEIETPETLDLSYRHSNLKENQKIVLSATFKLTKSDLPAEKLIEKAQQQRATQPPGFSSGSFFKNPSPDKPAGLLIDQAGLKGKRIGNAQISPKHGNFILNLGGATATDILALADLAQHEVETKFGIHLEPEVQIIPESLAS